MFADELDKLVSLQELDSGIFALREDVEGHAKRVAEWKAGMSKAAAELENLRAEHTRVKLRRRERETELKTFEEQIRKLQKTLNDVKTNKEYAAVQNEIGGLQRKSSEYEEEVLVAMERDEELTAREKDLSLLCDEERKSLDLRIAEEETRMDGVRGMLAAKEAERAAAVAAIEPEVYARYERVRKSKKDGVSICLLTEEHGKGVCSGCFMCVPTYIAEKVRAKREVVHCENCSRILR